MAIKPIQPEVDIPHCATARTDGRQLMWLAGLFALATVLVRIPFLLRFDLYFQSGLAPGYLIPKRMLLGEFPIYTWGTDYSGLGPGEFTAAGLFAVFGPSIALASFVSLVEWALGVALLVGFVGKYLSRRSAFAVGCTLTVGVPFFLMYCTQPFLTAYSLLPLYLGGFFWLTMLILERGPQSWWCAFTALLMGYFWYAHKHAVLVWLTVAVSLLAMAHGRHFLRAFVRTKMLWICIAAFLVGYSPEILYKLHIISHEDRVADAQRFLNIASPKMMAANWYMLFRCLPTYFDADPWSRTVEGVHYLNHLENWESFPQSAIDTVGLILAAVVIAYGLRLMFQSHQETNLPAFMLHVLPVVTAVLIVVAGKSEGSYYSIRRYLLPSGIIFLIWMGLRLGEAWRERQRLMIGLVGFWLCLSAVHQWQLLGQPDELADYKLTAKEIADAGYEYGLSWYSYSHTLTALSDERVKFGILDFSPQSPYQKAASTSEVVAVVWLATQAPPFEYAQHIFFGGVKLPGRTGQILPGRIQLLGSQYERVQEPRLVGELGWAPYRRLPHGIPTAQP